MKVYAVDTSEYRDWMAVPYKEFGRELTGADCWGWTRLFLKEKIGVDLAIYDGMTRPTPDTIRDQLKSGWRRLAEDEEPRPWDVVTYLQSRYDLHHIGVMIGNDHFLSMIVGSCVTTERLSTGADEWEFVRLYRYVG